MVAVLEMNEESDPDKGKGGKINQWSHRIAANHSDWTVVLEWIDYNKIM